MQLENRKTAMKSTRNEWNSIVLRTSYLAEDDKKEICSWKYEGDYEIYNLPSYEEMKNKKKCSLV